ncbi:MAG TPA: hypothetical protein VFD69_18690 [Vicinamibacterales bacterium]|nr:hypothetical protein [Vicinamibacterales bacterium]
MCKHLGWKGLVLCAALASASPALAQQQTVNFSIGGFVPRGEDGRVTGDVLNENRTFLVFDSDEFNSVTAGGEWLFPIGNFVEGGAGVSFSNRSVPTVYDCCVDNFGDEIEQELRLRRIPIDLTLRVLPLGGSSPIQVYFGGGLSLISWRYSETGDFIDFNSDGDVFTDTFVGSGTEAGGVALAGVRFQGRSATGGFEVKYHKADASFEADDDAFAGPKIDLGGWTYQATIGFRF